ncbi:MAG TPA: M20/M25/M40 family metallo-hydrolase [Thermoanaerobaculia bacterium]|nr:M20/M25/M40 family metallo-hydrolase [Thermoanaerobaculia bacterium]
MRTIPTASRRPLILSLFLLLATSAPACLGQAASSETLVPAAVQSQARALQQSALQGTRAYDIVRSLTVEVGPRLAGSPGDRAAVEWGLRTFKELGFSNVRAEKVTVPHWERGEESGAILTPYPQPVVLAALGGSVGTPEGGLEAEVIEVPTLEALSSLDPARAKGKIVFISTRMERMKDGSGYGRAVGMRGRGPSAAARLGAVALLIRSVGTDNNRTPHTGATRYEEGVERIPAAALSNPDADLLSAQIAMGKPVRFRLRLGARYLPDAESANVIGEIPGREAPEEIVLLGCHLDSWDLGTGAEDDAAGCGIMMEAARRIGELPSKPRRTIRVVLYANEEFGLSGARAYAETHAAELPKHVLAGESDFGSGKVWRISSRVDPARLPVIGLLADLLKPLDVERGNNEAGGGADLGPLRPARVPVVSLSQDGTEYFDWHHTANDTLDKVDPKDLDQNVAAWATVAYVAAEMPGDFGRAPEDRQGQ